MQQLLDHLRTPGWLRRWPWVGLALFVLGGLAFGAFAWSLSNHGPLTRQDVQVANDVYAVASRSPRLLIDLMIFGSFLGREVVALFTAALAVYFLYKRFWRELAMVVIGLGGSEVLFEVLSRLFNRHRPVFPKPVWEVLPGAGFPSGHSISAVLCYGLLAYLLVPKMPSRGWKATIILLAAFIIAFIGASRVFTGDHYLSDVLAGYSLGLAWGGLVYTTMELVFR